MKNIILSIFAFISIVTISFGQVKLTNRILVDPTLSDANDSSKRFKFNLSNFTGERIYTFPDSNITLVGESSIQSLINKTFNADSNTIYNITNNSIKSGAGIDATKIANGSVSDTEFQYLNGVTSNIVGVSDTQTFTNKTFTDATTYFQDNLDNTKKVQLDLSNITPASTRILTVPDADITIVGLNNQQTLYNKTLISPIINNINDTNGNKIISVTETSLAVNQLNISNSTTSNGPTISSSGIDTDIDLNINAKGSGKVKISGLLYPNTDGTNNQVLTSDGAGNLNWQTPSASIYGSNFHQQSSDALSQTTATTLQTKTTLTTSSLPAGTYRLGYSFEASNASNGVLTEVEVMIDGVIVALPTLEANNDFKLFGGFVYQSLSGVVTATIKYRVTTTGIAEIRRARLELWRVN